MGTDEVNSLPTGTVTFLFTDVEGSTRLWEEYPEQMQVALERHDELLRQAIEEHRGHVFTTAGDSFAAAFQDHDSAVSAARSAQVALERESWPSNAPIRVRMGIHTGNASERDGDYFGPALNLAARLMSAGHGGQVLCSASTHGLLSDDDSMSLGLHELKDLSAAQEIFQLRANDSRFPPLRTLDRIRHNLPVAPGPLFGRDTALGDVMKLVEAVPLVTIVGVGGIGKTRLALAVAADNSDQYDDGVWFCDLAPVSDSDAVSQVVLSALGTRQRPERSLVDSVTEFCRRKTMLLVLDNCEHVLDDVADLVEAVISVAPGTRFLATSREGLGMEGEVTYPLAPLEVDGRSPSFRLFLERASRVDPTWQPTEVDEKAIEQICKRLDGIPLAIILAAVRTRSMSPVEIEQHLNDAFRSLHSDRRSIGRHRTLQAAIEWSYDTLSEPEQLLFNRMAVFAGGCDLDAIDAICTDIGSINGVDIMDLIDDVVSKSLVVAKRSPSGTTRYRLLEPLRQFAADRLSRIDQQPSTRARHLEHYTVWAESWNADVWGAGTHLLERLDAEFANLRSAVNYAIEITDSDNALRLVYGMGVAQFGWERLEVGEWAHRVLDLDGVDAHPLGPSVAALVASTQWLHGDTVNYARYLDRAEAMSTFDPRSYQPTTARAMFTTQLHSDMHASKALFDRVIPTGGYERTMLAFARVQMTSEIDGPDVVDKTLARLRLDAESSGSSLIEIISNGSDALIRLRRFEFGAALTSARNAVNDAHAIGAQFLAHLYLFTLGLAAAAAGAVAPQDLELMRNGLREQRDAGNETDRWLLLVGAVAALGDPSPAEQVHRGLQTSVWANSRVATTLPLFFPNLASHDELGEDPPALDDLVDGVIAAIDRTLYSTQ